MDEADWLTASDARNHVAEALTLAGAKADDAPVALFAKAALGHDVLQASAERMSRAAAHFGTEFVMARFWNVMLKNKAAEDWLTGHFVCNDVRHRVATSRSGWRGEEVTQMLANGVRFRRDQVQALWPLPHAVIDDTSAADITKLLAPAGSVDLAAALQAIVSRHRSKSKAEIDHLTGPGLLEELQGLSPVQPDGRPYMPSHLKGRAYALRNELRDLVGLPRGQRRRFVS